MPTPAYAASRISGVAKSVTVAAAVQHPALQQLLDGAFQLDRGHRGGSAVQRRRCSRSASSVPAGTVSPTTAASRSTERASAGSASIRAASTAARSRESSRLPSEPGTNRQPPDGFDAADGPAVPDGPAAGELSDACSRTGTVVSAPRSISSVTSSAR